MEEMKFEEEADQVGADLDLEQDAEAREARKKYEFKKDNPYKSLENLLELAKKLIAEERSQDAIMVLEAEVQKNPASSEGWRLLGQLHAENDEDEPAVACLLV